MVFGPKKQLSIVMALGVGVYYAVLNTRSSSLLSETGRQPESGALVSHSNTDHNPVVAGGQAILVSPVHDNNLRALTEADIEGALKKLMLIEPASLRHDLIKRLLKNGLDQFPEKTVTWVDYYFSGQPVRYDYLVFLARHLLDGKPDLAAQIMRELPRSESAISLVVDYIAQTHFLPSDGLLQWSLTLSDDYLQMIAIQRVVAAWSKVDALAALSALQYLPAMEWGQYQPMLKQLGYAITPLDRAQVLFELSGQPIHFQLPVLKGMTQKVLREGPDAVYQWFNNMTDTALRDQLITDTVQASEGASLEELTGVMDLMQVEKNNIQD